MWPSAKAHALKADWQVTSDYGVTEDGSTTVRHIVDVKNTDGAKTPKTVNISVDGNNIRAISAESQDGGTAKTQLNEAKDAIAVTLSKDFTGNGRQWSFVLTYRANLVKKFGDSQMLQIEPLAISGASVKEHDVAVSIDLDLGFAILRGPKPKRTQVGIGDQVFRYEQKNKLFDQGLIYFFGEKSLATGTFKSELKNDSLWWQTKTVVLPPDTNQQRVIIDSIEPVPTRVTLDRYQQFLPRDPWNK